MFFLLAKVIMNGRSLYPLLELTIQCQCCLSKANYLSLFLVTVTNESQKVKVQS